MTDRQDRRKQEAAERGAAALAARYGRIVRRGVVVSVALHLALFLVLLGLDVEPPSPFAAAGPPAGDDRAAAGGGMESVTLRFEPPPPAIPPPAAPLPTPDIVVEIEPEPEAEPEVEPIDFSELAGTVAEPAPGDPGPDTGVGVEDGAGAGDGGTEDEGLFRVVPPVPRGLILPPADRPSRVRGREVTVWVFVSEDGKVVADSTRILPSSGDRRFDDRLRGHASEWVFEPARRRGEAIAEWFRYIVTL